MRHGLIGMFVVAGLMVLSGAGCRSVEYSVRATNISEETVAVRLMRNSDRPDETPRMASVLDPGGVFEWSGSVRRGRNATVSVRRYASGKEFGDRAYIVLVPKGHAAADIDVEDSQIVIRNYESRSAER